MNSKKKFVLVFVIFFTSVGAITNTNRKETIKIEKGDNLTLPCHPSEEIRNSIKDANDFKWTTDNDITIYAKGILAEYLYYDSVNTEHKITNSSLELYNIYHENITYTCHILHLGINFTYFIHTNNLRHAVEKPLHIAFGRKITTVTLSCDSDQTFTSASTNVDYIWILKNTKQNIIHTITPSNQLISSNNHSNYQILANGSLVIKHFQPNHQIFYECYLPSGSYTRYYSAPVDETVTLINKTIGVGRGTDLTLRCSDDLGVTPRNFMWLYNRTEVLTIGGNVITSSLKSNIKIYADRCSLTIKNFSALLNGIYTCVTSFGEQLEYEVAEKNSIKQTFIAREGQSYILSCSMKINDEDDSDFVWKRNSEILFINNNEVEGSYTDYLQIYAEDKRSLIISPFSAHLAGVYTCYSARGLNYSYTVVADKVNIVKKTIVVEFGMNNIELSCPLVNKIENASYEWIYQKQNSDSPSFVYTRGKPDVEGPIIEKLRLLYLNGKPLPGLSYDGFEIDENASLLIKFMKTAFYGLYTCRWSTGQQCIFNVTIQSTRNNHVFHAINGENVTLPCPMVDPRDRELNVLQWAITLGESSQRRSLGGFLFTDGKMFPALSPFPKNCEIAEDKQSLLIRNISFDSAGVYECQLVRSRTFFRYTVNIAPVNEKKLSVN